MKSGSDFIGLSQRDLSKITAQSLVRYLDLAAESVMDEEFFEGLSGRSYGVPAFVRPGCEESESRKAIELGLASEPLQNLQSVTLRGTLKQLLAFIKDNSDLIEIIEIGNTWFDDPLPDPGEEEISGKTVNLKGCADELSGFTTAHNIGLTGSGRTIAIIDTGFVSSHEQFSDRNGKSRFIKEACFSVTGAVALVRQLYPGMLPQDAGKFLKYISEKTVSQRVTADNKFIDYKFDFSKPVLDLRKIAGKLLPQAAM